MNRNIRFFSRLRVLGAQAQNEPTTCAAVPWVFLILLSACSGESVASGTADGPAAMQPRLDGASMLGGPDAASILDGGSEAAKTVDAGPDGATALDGGVNCPATPLAPGDYLRGLRFGGRSRQYHLHVPPGYRGTSQIPMVIAYHGGGGSALGQERVMHLTDKSDGVGFILALPEGTGARPDSTMTLSWNAGTCCKPATDNNVDDVGFTRAMIDAISSEACIDPRRIFATGHSNGAILSHRLACELSDRIAAIAPVAGGIGIPDCRPKRPVPIFHIHGLVDRCYPFAGGQSSVAPVASAAAGPFVGIPATIAGWVDRNHAAATAVPTFTNGAAKCETYKCTDANCADVTLCTVDGGGHAWPGSDMYPSKSLCGGVLTQELKANDAMWEFFVAHPMP